MEKEEGEMFLEIKIERGENFGFRRGGRTVVDKTASRVFELGDSPGSRKGGGSVNFFQQTKVGKNGRSIRPRKKCIYGTLKRKGERSSKEPSAGLREPKRSPIKMYDKRGN